MSGLLLDISLLGAKILLPRYYNRNFNVGYINKISEFPVDFNIPFQVISWRDAGPERVLIRANFPLLNADDRINLQNLLLHHDQEESRSIDRRQYDFIIQGYRQIYNFLHNNRVMSGKALDILSQSGRFTQVFKPIKLDREDRQIYLYCRLKMDPCPVQMGKGDFWMSFSGFIALNFIEASRIEYQDQSGLYKIAVADRILQIVNRKFPRIALSRHEEIPISFSYINTLFGHEEIDKDVIDISAFGVSLNYDMEQDSLLSGTKITELNIKHENSEIFTQGTVRNVIMGNADEYLGKMGVSFDSFFSEEDANNWFRVYFKYLYPEIEVVSSHEYERIYDTIIHSEYKDLIPAPMRKEIQNSFSDAYQKVKPDSSVFTGFVLRRNKRDIGSCSLHRVFSNTFAPNQYSIVRGDEAENLSLAEVFEVGRTLSSSVLEFFKVQKYPYFLLQADRNKEWSKVFNEAFAMQEGLKFKEYHIFDVINVWRLPPREFDSALTMSGRIREVDSGWELEEILAYLSRTLPPIELKGYDYVPEEIKLASLKVHYGDVLRDRKILACYEGVDLIAFTICEITHGGINVFGLFNAIRPFFVTPDHPERESLFRELILASVREYKRFDSIPIVLLSDFEGHDFYKATMQGFEGVLFDEGIRWLVDQNVGPYYTTYLKETIAKYIDYDRCHNDRKK